MYVLLNLNKNMYKTKSPHFMLEKIILRAHLLFQGFKTELHKLKVQIQNIYMYETKYYNKCLFHYINGNIQKIITMT